MQLNKNSTETFKPAPGSELWLLKCVATTATEEIPSPQEWDETPVHQRSRSPEPDPARWPPARDYTVSEDSPTIAHPAGCVTDTIQPDVQSAVVTHGNATEHQNVLNCVQTVLGLNLSWNGAFIFQQCRKLMKAWGKLAGAFNKKHLLMHLKWEEDVQSLYTRTSRGRFICNFTYLYGCQYKCWFTKIILWEPNSEGNTLESQPHQRSPWWCEAVCGVGFVGGSVSQSWFSIFEVEDIPPASATCPWPPFRVWGEADDQMALEVQAASWTQHPPHPQPHCYIPGPTSTLWPPPPLPRSKPLSPSARQCCMTGQTQSFTKTHPVSLLCQCLGSQENRHDNGESRSPSQQRSSYMVAYKISHDYSSIILLFNLARITANWAAYGWRWSHVQSSPQRQMTTSLGNQQRE